MTERENWQEPGPRPPELVLGTAQLCAAYGLVRRRPGAPTPGDADRLLAHAAAMGLRALDTAPAYGEAESVIGRSTSRFTVHTKLDPSVLPEESVRRSVQRLLNKSIDIIYLHDSTLLTHGESALLDRAVAAAARCGARLGASIYTVQEFDAALSDPRIEAVQVPLNVLDRRFAGGTLDRAAEQATAVYARSILLQGLLAADAVPDGEAMVRLGPFIGEFTAIARFLGRSSLALAMGWAKQIKGLTGIVIGSDNVQDLDALLRTFNGVRLDPVELARIDTLQTPPFEWVDPRSWSMQPQGKR